MIKAEPQIRHIAPMIQWTLRDSPRSAPNKPVPRMLADTATMFAVRELSEPSDLMNITPPIALKAKRAAIERSLKARTSDDENLPMQAAIAPIMPDKAAKR
jgi:hypothetical protein